MTLKNARKFSIRKCPRVPQRLLGNPLVSGHPSIQENWKAPLSNLDKCGMEKCLAACRATDRALPGTRSLAPDHSCSGTI
jgi:hypothetical protein